MRVDSPTFQTLTRRSTRVRARIPLLITGLDPARPLWISCETLIVNGHGCAARLPQALDLGTPARIHVRGTEATARVAVCQPLGEKPSAWAVGFELDTPGNIWGLYPCPRDWPRFETDAASPEATASQTAMTRPPSQLKMPVWPLASPSAKTALPPKAGDEELKKQLAAQQEAIDGLQDRLASSLASVPELVRKQISKVEEQMLVQVRQQLSVAVVETVRPLREELAVCHKKAEDAQQIRAAVAEQFERLPWQIQQHTDVAFQPLQERARAEIQRLFAEARPQYEQESARLQALEASAQALQKELAQARALLESSMGSLPERIHQPIAAAVEDALAQARAEISRRLARELDSLRSEHDHLKEIGAKREELQREELQLWLAEQQSLFVQYVSQRLEQLTNELASGAAGALQEKLRTDVEEQAKHIEADLNQRLGPILKQASDLRQEVLSVVSALQRESKRGETQVCALLKEKDGVEAWVAERVADFRKMFHETLVETTGQIEGRLHMAVETAEGPLAKLRDESAQQLQEQATRQARLLREQVDEACDRLTRLQRQVENSVGESLRAQAAETCVIFGREIAEVAQRSVEERRSALTKNLESLASILGQPLSGGEK
jgi:hypothetical protein